ncbi:MAG: single-stranded-DNA-specific exonuclease RecJ, partial [Burkholderiales bacterium]
MAFGTNKSSPLDDPAAAGLIPHQFVPISGAAPPPPWGMPGTPIFDLLTYLYARRGADFQEEQAFFLSMKETLRQVDRPIGDLGFLGMEKATRLLHDALVNKIHIVIVGDFDVDGVCATAILMRALRPFTTVTAVIPDRKTEGYGLSPALIPRIPESAGLVITVDNGISAMAGARMVRQRGQKLLITDHHLPGDQAPDADAIINPNQHGCPFPWKSTCGAGVAWYLLWALQTIYPEWKTRMPIRALLSLVALATVADVVPLERNNRLLVRLGLDIIRRGAHVRRTNGRCGDAPIGLYALFRVSGRNAAQASSTDCGFSLGPRLNAAGRMANMSQGLDLLLSDDATQAQTMAEALQKINQERRAVEGTAMEEAVEQAMSTLPDNLTCRGHHTCSADSQKNILVLADPRWHEGVVGLMAGRLKERFGSPV